MPVAGTRPPLAEALERLERWREEADRDLRTGFTALTEEEAQVQKALAESQRQLRALALVRQELEEQRERLEVEQQRRAWESVQRSLAADQSVLQERALMLYRANQEKRARLLTELQGMSGGEELGHPHRTGLPDRLRPYGLALEIPARVYVARSSIAVIASTEPEEGPIQVLLLLTPVPFAIWGGWSGRVDPVPDLCAQLAWRILAAIYQLMADISAFDAPVRFLDIQGSLGLQVWLGDHAVPADFRERAMEAIQGVHADASELDAVGIDVYGFWLKPDLVGMETE